MLSKSHFNCRLRARPENLWLNTAFSQITTSFARTLRAMTHRYFELKIGLALLAFAF
jgi:hypothetical protein